MDNSRGTPPITFGPSPGLTAACLIGGLLVGVIAAFDGDDAGRLLIGLAAVLLIALGCYDALVSPRLVASADGLTVRTAGLRAQLPWTEVDEVRLDERSRLGLSSRTLEIDAGSALVVLGRHSLGREPREAFALVSALRPAPGS